MIRLATLTLAGTLAGATFVPALPQDDGAQRARDLPKASEVVAVTFRPEHLDANQLFNAARGMLATTLMVQDDESGAVSQRSNVQVVGDTLVLFDLPGAAKRNFELLEQLDFEAGRGSEDEAWIRKDYRPRHMSVPAATDALGAFESYGEVFEVRESGVIVMNGPKSVVEEMREFIVHLDQPSPQVMLTCYLVKPGDSGSADLPGELVRGLAELTGIGSFEREAIGMVRSSVEANTMISVLLDSGPGETFSLDLVPAALDQDTDALTFSQCRLTTRMSATFGHGVQLFQTATTVESGRYTVLGAAGAAPYFVVLQVAPARN